MLELLLGYWEAELISVGPRDPKAHFRLWWEVGGGGSGGGMVFCNTVEYGVLGVPKVVLVF